MIFAFILISEIDLYFFFLCYFNYVCFILFLLNFKILIKIVFFFLKVKNKNKKVKFFFNGKFYSFFFFWLEELLVFKGIVGIFIYKSEM